MYWLILNEKSYIMYLTEQKTINDLIPYIINVYIPWTMVIHFQNTSIKTQGKKYTVNPGHFVQLQPVTLIKIRLMCREICYQELGLVWCSTYVSHTEQWWQRSGFITWQRSQNLTAEDMEIKEISCPPSHPITCLPSKHSAKWLYSCSCCGNVHIKDRWLCVPPDWARVKMGSFLAISARICFWTSGLSSISYLSLSEYDNWN